MAISFPGISYYNAINIANIPTILDKIVEKILVWDFAITTMTN